MKLEFESNTASMPLVEHHDANAVANEHNSPEVMEMLRDGIKAAQEGNRAEARQLLLRVTEADPNNENAWLWLASISEYPEELLVFLNNVLKINPDNQRANEWAKATKSLLAKTFVQRGINAAKEEQKDFAKQCFLQAIVHDDKSELAWLWLASVSNAPEEKVSHLQKVLNINPENENALSSMASAKMQIAQALMPKAKQAAVEGNHEEAHKVLDKALKEAPNLEEAWLLKSHLSDSLSEKIIYFEKVLAINPNNEAAKAGLASLKSIVGEMPKNEEEKAEVEPNVEEQVAEDASMEEDQSDEPEFSAEVEEEVVQEEEVLEDTEPQIEFEEDVVEYVEVQSVPVEEVQLEESYEIESEAEEVFEAQAENHQDEMVQAEDHQQSFEEASHEEPIEEVENQEEVQAEESVVELHLENENEALQEEAEEFHEELEDQQVEMEEVSPEVVEEYSFDSDVQEEDEAEVEMQNHEEESYDYEDAEEQHVQVEEEFHQEREEQHFEEAEAQDFPNEEEDHFAEPSMPQFEEVDKSEVSMPTSANDQPAKLMSCPFCNEANEAQSFVCKACRAILTLSDIEMILGHEKANKEIIKQAVEMMEEERKVRNFDAEELKYLGIGYINIKDMRKGFEYLQESVQANPEDVMLVSHLDALAIRLAEIEKQEKDKEEKSVSANILVVDDSPTVRKLISGKLEKSGHEVTCAVDGMDALAKINEVIPDLILLDITMPRMDGYQVCKLIRSNEATQDVPVVMISGKDGFFDKVRGKMAGTTNYITKPFGPETLMKTVNEYIS